MDDESDVGSRVEAEELGLVELVGPVVGPEVGPVVVDELLLLVVDVMIVLVV